MPDSYQHRAGEVFSFAGHIEGQPPVPPLSGYAVAEGPQQLIEGMARTGFVVQAMTSLAELDQMIGILEAIASKDPAVDANDVVDVHPNDAPYPADGVFCFSGHIAHSDGTLKSGFIIATDVQFVISYLESFGFVVQSASSLADFRKTRADLAAVAKGEYDDGDFNLINLLEATV